MNALEQLLFGPDDPFNAGRSSPLADLNAEVFWLRWWVDMLEQALLDVDEDGIRYCRARIRELVRDACTAGHRAARWEPRLASLIATPPAHVEDTLW